MRFISSINFRLFRFNRGFPIILKFLYRSAPLPTRLKKIIKKFVLAFFQQSDPYSDWVKKYSVLGETDRRSIQMRLSEMPFHPTISILMPVWNPPIEFLKVAIESVLGQIYLHWELCIADDCSTSDNVRSVLKWYASQDARIKVAFRTSNGHISEASNTALDSATGEFVALMDQDDVLPEYALYWIAEEICKFPDVELIYTDEDLLGERNRTAPYFKPDWNPDLLLSQNCVTHLGVYRTERVRMIGGFRKGFEGAQDWDLVLRFTKGLDSRKIRHIPWILYHWRMHPNSTAATIDAKPYAWDAGNRAILDFLRSCGTEASVEETEKVHHRVRYKLLKPFPLVSVVILADGPSSQIQNTILSLFEQTSYENFEVIIFERESLSLDVKSIDSWKFEEKLSIIQRNASEASCSAYDRAVSCAKGNIVIFLHDDVCVIGKDWMEEIVSQSLRSEIGVVGAKILSPYGEVEHAGIILGMDHENAHRLLPADNPGYAARASLVQNFSAVSGVCFGFRKCHWAQNKRSSNGIPSTDLEFSLRLLGSGYRNLMTPYAILRHDEARSDRKNSFSGVMGRVPGDLERLRTQWTEFFENDPAFNPNLSLSSGLFKIADMPRIVPPWKVHSSK